MPRFFFDIRDGEYQPDETGVELPGLQEARVQAVVFAAGMLKDNPGGQFWQGHDWQVEVRDDRGLVLFTLGFTVTDMTGAPDLPRAAPPASAQPA